MSKGIGTGGYAEVVFTDGFKSIVRLSDFGSPNNKGAAIDTLVATHGKVKEINLVSYMPT